MNNTAIINNNEQVITGLYNYTKEELEIMSNFILEYVTQVDNHLDNTDFFNLGRFYTNFIKIIDIEKEFIYTKIITNKDDFDFYVEEVKVLDIFVDLISYIKNHYDDVFNTKIKTSDMITTDKIHGSRIIFEY